MLGHAHANGGESFWSRGAVETSQAAPSTTTYWANAVRKHGPESFEDRTRHGPEAEVNAQEIFWIGSEGLHTIKGNGGWGYNERGGGEGGRLAPSAIAKIKTSMARPEVVEKQRASGKAQFEREETADPGCHSRRAKAQWDYADSMTRPIG